MSEGKKPTIVRDVVNNDDSVCTTVVGGSDSAEALLPWRRISVMWDRHRVVVMDRTCGIPLHKSK